MKVTEFRTHPLRLPYRNPMKTATNYFDTTAGLLVEAITDKGDRGYGYADLFPRTGESILTAQAMIHEVLAPGLMGRDPCEVQILLEWMDKKVTGNRRAKAALETALQDLRGKAVNVPVYELLGGAVRRTVSVMKMVGLKEPEGMAEEAIALVREGIKALKLKIGTGWKEDTERVRQVRKAVGDKIFLKVDANQSYSVQEALRVARAIEEFGVETFEQPVAADDWEGMIRLNQQSPVPIEADQTVRSVADALRAIRLGAASVINTSPQKVGGVSRAKQIADLCEIARIPCILSNVGGSIVGDAAAVQVIAASRSTHLPCEVGEFQRVIDDPATGLEIRNGELHVPTAPGLGVEVALGKYKQSQ